MAAVSDFHLVAILLGLVVLAVAVVVVHMLTGAGRDREQAPGNEGQGWRRPKATSYSLAELCEVRFSKGVAESLQFLQAYEVACVEELASEHVSEEHEKQLQTTLDILGRYRRLAEDEDLPERQKEWLSLARDLRKECTGGRGGVLVYEMLDNLRASLASNDFDLAMSNLAKFKGKLEIRGTPEFEAALLQPLRKVTEVATKFEAAAPDDRGRRSQMCTEVLDVLEKALQQANVGRNNKFLHEVADLSDLLGKTLQMARDRRVQLIDKPVFEVSYLGDKERLVVSGTTLDMKFKIVNVSQKSGKAPDKAQSIPEIRVKIEPLTTKLECLTPPKHLSILSGEADLECSFNTFFLDTEGDEEQARLRFQLEYTFVDKTQRPEMEVLLPRFEVVRRIVNPFEEARGGGGLAGKSELFVGRKDILGEIASGLLRQETEPVFHLLVGLPRSGKTSVLRQLAENESWLGGKVTPLWVRGRIGSTRRPFYEEIFDKIRKTVEAKIHLPDPSKKESRPKDHPARIYDFLDGCKDGMKKARLRMLIVLDEYQEYRDADSNAEEQTESIASFLKSLRDAYADVVSVVMAGLYSLEDNHYLKRPQWLKLLGGRFETLAISNLAKSEANDLLSRPLARHGISIDDACLVRAWTYTRGHPFLHALIGYYTFKRLMASETKYREGKTVGLGDVDAAARSIDGADMKFIWSEEEVTSTMSIRLFLAAIAQRTAVFQRQSGDPTACPWSTVHEVRQFLETYHQKGVASYRFEGEIGILRERRLLEVDPTNSQRYRLVYPVFAHYCDETNQLAAILGESSDEKDN